MSRYARPQPLGGDIGDLLSEDLRLSVFGAAILREAEVTFFHTPLSGGFIMSLPARTFPTRTWNCFLCDASFVSPYGLSDHVPHVHPKEHAFFLRTYPAELAKCPVEGQSSFSHFPICCWIGLELL